MFSYFTSIDSPSEVLDSDLPTELSPTLQERFLRIKQKVKDAINAHHTFMIYGRARVIRETLLKKGWCEKFFRKNSNGNPSSLINFLWNNLSNLFHVYFCFCFTVEQYLHVESNPIILLRGIGDLKDQQSERQLISRMLSNHTVDFLWNTGSEWPGWPSQENKTTVFNRFYRAGFTSKVTKNFPKYHWWSKDAINPIKSTDRFEINLDNIFTRYNIIPLDWSMFERQTDALVLRGWSSQHFISTLL